MGLKDPAPATVKRLAQTKTYQAMQLRVPVIDGRKERTRERSRTSGNRPAAFVDEVKLNFGGQTASIRRIYEKYAPLSQTGFT